MSKPNILFLLPDQLRPDFLGCYGARFLKTPSIDALAARGTLYENAISPSPICVPARASMLTGKNAHANGVIDNLSWLRPDRGDMGIATWPELLSDAGYMTAAIGKMHFYPWDEAEGFEHRVIAEDKRHINIEDDYHRALTERGLRKLHGNDQRLYRETKGASFNDLPDDMQPDRWVARESAAFLRDYRDERPFALMVGFPGPHCPYDPPEEALAQLGGAAIPDVIPPTEESMSHRDSMIASYRRGWADLDYTEFNAAHTGAIRRHYTALVERLDSDVGTILAALQETGKLEDTIIVFASDHGDYLGDFGLIGKTYFHEPSIRVPLIVADFRSAHAPAARDTGLRSLLDLFPSLLGWAGVTECQQADGFSLETPANPDRIVTGVTTHGVMARGVSHKLVRYLNGAEALFDLAGDPYEQKNRIYDQELAPVRRRLEAALCRDLVSGMIAGHTDKRVREAQAAPPHPFYQTGWTRRYPAPATDS